MNTGLGLSFLRIVNEEGSNGWAQVYARVPFDDVELKEKGSLFGVVFGKDKEGWAARDTELMSWVEEYFNHLDSGGDLAVFFRQWKDRYPELSGAWIWVMAKADGNREMKIILDGRVGAMIVRNGQEFDFAKSLEEGKVLSGKVLSEDKIAIWTEGLTGREKEISEISEETSAVMSKGLVERNIAGAGIVLNFQTMVNGGVSQTESSSRELESVYLENKRIEPEPEAEEVIKGKTSNFGLVEDKYVGPIGVKEKLSNWWAKSRTRKEHPKRKRWAVFLGILFLFLLTVSLITGSLKMKKEAEMKKWLEFSEPIEKSLKEAENLVTLNPSGAKKLVEEVRGTFDLRKAEFENTKYKENLIVLEQKINQSWTTTSGEKESDIEDILRIDLVRQGFKGERLGLIKDDNLLVIDTNMGVIVTAEKSTKDIRVVAGKGEGLGWIDGVADGSRTLVMTSSGIRNALNGEDVITFDSAVAKPISVSRFGSNIYVLDQGNKEIYRYAAVEGGYADRARWLKTDESISIEPIDMAIDSDIWVVSENGQVQRFRRGVKEQFTISGLPEGVKISRIAVETEGEKVALLDNNSGLVAVCSKESGQCSEILKSSRLKEAKDVEYDEDGTLLVLFPGVVGVVK